MYSATPLYTWQYMDPSGQVPAALTLRKETPAIGEIRIFHRMLVFWGMKLCP